MPKLYQLHKGHFVSYLLAILTISESGPLHIKNVLSQLKLHFNAPLFLYMYLVSSQIIDPISWGNVWIYLRNILAYPQKGTNLPLHTPKLHWEVTKLAVICITFQDIYDIFMSLIFKCEFHYLNMLCIHWSQDQTLLLTFSHWLESITFWNKDQ